VRQSLVLDGPSEVVLTDDLAGHVDFASDGQPLIRDAFGLLVARACVMCHLPVKAPNAKTCSDACARARKTRLQREQRARRRPRRDVE